MFENIIAGILTIFCTIKAISFGVWTIRRKNTAGGVATILLSLASLSLMGIYFFTLS